MKTFSEQIFFDISCDFYCENSKKSEVTQGCPSQSVFSILVFRQFTLSSSSWIFITSKLDLCFILKVYTGLQISRLLDCFIFLEHWRALAFQTFNQSRCLDVLCILIVEKMESRCSSAREKRANQQICKICLNGLGFRIMQIYLIKSLIYFKQIKKIEQIILFWPTPSQKNETTNSPIHEFKVLQNVF